MKQNPTAAQRYMLDMVHHWSGSIELGELVRECSTQYDSIIHSGLSWRIADRTAGALLRREWIVLDGDIVHMTVRGQIALNSK